MPPPTSSRSSGSPWPPSAVTPARVEAVLAEVQQQLGNSIAAMHSMARRARAWSVGEALREDADALALTQRAVRELRADLEAGVRAEVEFERRRLRVAAEEGGRSTDRAPAADR